MQVYVHRKDSKLVKELAGFDKIFLKKNESAKVTIEIESWQDDAEWYIGSSLSDIRLSN
ncbi:MAG: fibronectin type III-like domain-contianing protein [Agathobacter sp.]|nr:fibronectin type III-like domain-contianing protein [Agathobacter sp.]